MSIILVVIRGSVVGTRVGRLGTQFIIPEEPTRISPGFVQHIVKEASLRFNTL